MVFDDIKIPESISDLQLVVVELYKKVQQYEIENKLLREKIRKLTQAIYGRKTEKYMLEEIAEQGILFEEMEAVEEKVDEGEGEEVTVANYSRKKGGRKPLPEDLPREEIILEVKESEKVCGCGSTMVEIGREVMEQLEMTPPQFLVKRYIRRKFACKNCEGLESQGAVVKIAALPEQLIPKSFCTGSLLAYIVTSKFADAIPFYRQEKQFSRYGIELSRSTMCNWLLKVWEKSHVMVEILLEELLSGPLIQADETPFQVLVEEGKQVTSKSYMWVFCGGERGRRIILYKYHRSRRGEVAAGVLKGYQGYVQTDGYSGYGFLEEREGIVHVGCWAHVRRKFTEVLKVIGKNKGDGRAEKALRLIGKLYDIESRAKEEGLSEEDLLAIRQEKSKEVVEEFERFLKENGSRVLPKSLLGEGITYGINQLPRLKHFLEDGIVPLDNNGAENAIRPFVVGRKNWLFSYNEDGASASAFFYSIIETAKANGLEPYKYLRYLFEKLPQAKTKDDYRRLLPQNIDRENFLKAVNTS